MLYRLCKEGVWKVLVGCLESTSRVSGRWMEGVFLALIGGCLEVCEGCLEGVRNVSKSCLEA